MELQEAKNMRLIALAIAVGLCTPGTIAEITSPYIHVVKVDYSAHGQLKVTDTSFTFAIALGMEGVRHTEFD